MKACPPPPFQRFFISLLIFFSYIFSDQPYSTIWRTRASITCTIVRVHVSVHTRSGDKLFSRGLKEKWSETRSFFHFILFRFSSELHKGLGFFLLFRGAYASGMLRFFSAHFYFDVLAYKWMHIFYVYCKYIKIWIFSTEKLYRVFIFYF